MVFHPHIRKHCCNGHISIPTHMQHEMLQPPLKYLFTSAVATLSFSNSLSENTQRLLQPQLHVQHFLHLLQHSHCSYFHIHNPKTLLQQSLMQYSIQFSPSVATLSFFHLLVPSSISVATVVHLSLLTCSWLILHIHIRNHWHCCNSR